MRPAVSFAGHTPRKPRCNVQYFGNSDCGRVRLRNQDRYLLLPLGESGLLAAVFDGMGGHADGDLAAETAADAFADAFRGRMPASPDEGGRLLCEAAYEADRRIAALAEADPRRLGMGTTVTALLFLGGAVLSLNVGDSRAYCYRMGEMLRLTHDDSYVQALVDAGVITPEEAPYHPRRNVLTRSLGALGGGEIEVSVHSVARGDTYLLCSDGLYGMTGEDFMQRILCQQLSLGATVGYLLAAANERGGEDNITALLVRI